MSTFQSTVPKFKVILLGDTGVGKTSIARRQVQGNFEFKMTPTVGASHLRSTISVANEPVELMLWDTAGQEQFASLVPMYARGAHVCVIVASIVNPDSCDNVNLWRDRLFESGEKPPIVVAVNKIDLLEGAPLDVASLKEQLSNYPSLYFVSARTGDCIDQLFLNVAQLAMAGRSAEKLGVDIGPKQEETQGGCC
jgi:small GTP-binding protein